MFAGRIARARARLGALVTLGIRRFRSSGRRAGDQAAHRGPMRRKRTLRLTAKANYRQRTVTMALGMGMAMQSGGKDLVADDARSPRCG